VLGFYVDGVEPSISITAGNFLFMEELIHAVG
jgi:hypothetical protein